MEKNISNVQELLIKLNEIKVILEIGTNDRIGYENYNYDERKKIEKMISKLTRNTANYKDKDEKTPLMICIEKRLFGLAKKILEKEPFIGALDDRRENILMKLCDNKYQHLKENKESVNIKIELVKEIVKRINLEERNIDGMTALDIAEDSSPYIEEEIIDIILEEINNKFDLNQLKKLLDKTEENYLFRACRLYNIKIIKEILEKDMSIDIDQKDNEGKTALMSFCLNANNINKLNLEIAKIFINDRKADINVKDNESKSVLIHACDTGHLEIVKLLIEKGADINHKDKLGLNALVYAAVRANNDSIVKILLENKIELVADSKHRNIWNWAIENNKKEILEIIRKNYEHY
jgi:ankyrin repeat protein